MPFLAVYAHRQVDFDVLDAANVTCPFPWELTRRVPGLAHAKKSGMGYGLGIRGDTVVVMRREIHVLGL